MGCWRASGDHLVSTASLLLVAFLCGGAGMGLWHGAKFYEMEKVRGSQSLGSQLKTLAKLPLYSLFPSGPGREPELLPDLAGVHPRADGLHGGLVVHRLLGRARTHPRRQGPFTCDVCKQFLAFRLIPLLCVKSRNLPFKFGALPSNPTLCGRPM